MAKILRNFHFCLRNFNTFTTCLSMIFIYDFNMGWHAPIVSPAFSICQNPILGFHMLPGSFIRITASVQLIEWTGEATWTSKNSFSHRHLTCQPKRVGDNGVLSVMKLSCRCLLFSSEIKRWPGPAFILLSHLPFFATRTQHQSSFEQFSVLFIL